jgi:hypothetical protein
VVDEVAELMAASDLAVGQAASGKDGDPAAVR